MQVLHYIMLVCLAITATAPQAESALPSSVSPYIAAAAAIASVIAGVCGGVTGPIGLNGKKDA